MRNLVLIALLLLVGCGDGNSPPPYYPPPPPPVSDATAATTMTASIWQFEHSPNMPATPMQRDDASWQFDFPPQNGVHYLTYPVSGKIVGSQFVVTTQIERNGQLLEVEPCGENVARMRMFFQRRGDNLSGAGAYEHYRWWSVPTFLLNNGSAPVQFAVSMLNASQWSSVFGKTGDQAPAEWQAAMLDVQRVGMTFGGCFAGHGVYVNGSARFIASGFSIQ